MKKHIILYILLLYYLPATAQNGQRGIKTSQLGANINLGSQLAGGDLSSRFGLSQSVGVGLEYIVLPKGWIANLGWQLYFGRNVKEDVLASMRTSDGNIISDIGTYASVKIRQRSFFTGLNLGKLWAISDDGNKVIGLRLTLGAGMLQHKVRIQDNNNSAPQVAPPYQAGYDRLTNGPALTQSFGFQIVSRDKRINGFIVLECTEGFTQNRRGFNFDTRQLDNQKRLDILYGIKAGWSIILYSNQSGDNIEY